MRIYIGLFSLLALSATLPSAHAQMTPTGRALGHTPEIALSYDLVGSNAPAGQCGCFVLNGGSMTAAVHISLRGVSIAGQVSLTHAGSIGTPKYDLSLLTYLGGVRYTMPLKKDRFNLFAQGLVGGSHASGSLVGTTQSGAGNSAIAIAGSIGGGLDIRWKRSIDIRALEVDYQPTTVDNNTTALENNYRISVGIVFHVHK